MKGISYAQSMPEGCLLMENISIRGWAIAMASGLTLWWIIVRTIMET